jgi:hypothetical protein
MSNPNDEVKDSVSSDLDRRTMLRTALMVGGAAALTGVAATAHAATATAPAAAAVQTAPPAEAEWARALTRVIVNQLPQAIAQAPDIRLTTAQVAELQRLFSNTLLTNMGCTVTG